MLDRIAEVYELYGFEPLETSAVETLDALGKFLPDVDRPNDGVFAWRDDDQWIALRYDLTAPLARVAAQHRNSLPSPYRRYAIGPVWRNEKPGPDRFRQFYQCDADTVGSDSMAADAEMCVLAAEILEAVGLERGSYRIRISNRKILDGALQAAGIFDPDDKAANADMKTTVLRAIDKLDRIGLHGVRDLLGKGRCDQSGDYTKGAGLTDSQAEFVTAFMELSQSSSEATLEELSKFVGSTRLGSAGIEELEQVYQFAVDQGVAGCVIDLSLVRGLEYYTGPVVEAELLFDVPDKKGRLRKFGSVAGGGRYDGLVRRFTGQNVPATGISIGVDRLLAAQSAVGSVKPANGPVVVTVMDRSALSAYLGMAAELRSSGVRAEVFLGNARNFGRQMKYADQRNAPIAVIEGSEERERGVIQLKDLKMGKELADSATHQEWKSKPTQIAVPRSEMVAHIKKMLDTG